MNQVHTLLYFRLFKHTYLLSPAPTEKLNFPTKTIRRCQIYSQGIRAPVVPPVSGVAHFRSTDDALSSGPPGEGRPLGWTGRVRLFPSADAPRWGGFLGGTLAYEDGARQVQGEGIADVVPERFTMSACWSASPVSTSACRVIEQDVQLAWLFAPLLARNRNTNPLCLCWSWPLCWAGLATIRKKSDVSQASP